MKNKYAYLTIDDAPSKDFIQKVEFLDTKKISVVWFCRGENIEKNITELIYAIKKNQLIANHAWDHPAFSNLIFAECKKQIKDTDDIIDLAYSKAKIKRPAKFFRFPYGDKGGNKNRNDYEKNIPFDKKGKEKKNNIQKYLKKLGYVQPDFKNIKYNYFLEAGFLNDIDWQWTYNCFEYTIFSHHEHGIDSIEKVLFRMDEDVPEGGRGLNNYSSEDIILLHDHEKTTQFFKKIISRLLEKKIIFKSVL